MTERIGLVTMANVIKIDMIIIEPCFFKRIPSRVIEYREIFHSAIIINLYTFDYSMLLLYWRIHHTNPPILQQHSCLSGY